MAFPPYSEKGTEEIVHHTVSGGPLTSAALLIITLHTLQMRMEGGDLTRDVKLRLMRDPGA